jgi:AraC-like DNA-binding protein
MAKVFVKFDRLKWDTVGNPFSHLPEIRSLGTMIYDPVWGRNFHPTHCCEMLHILKGVIDLEIGGRHYLAAAGDTLVIPPNVSHRDGFDFENGLEIFAVFFTWPDADAFFSRIDNDAIRAFSVGQKNELNRIFDAMRQDRMSGNEDADRALATARVLHILTLMLKNHAYNENDKCAESDLNVGHARRHRLFLDAKAFLEEHYHEPISLEEIAEALHVSPFHLSRVFSSESDFSLFSYLTEFRMGKARELLKSGRMNVSEVAERVGYENGGYFSKVFKRYHGMSPSEYAFTKPDKGAPHHS